SLQSGLACGKIFGRRAPNPCNRPLERNTLGICIRLIEDCPGGRDSHCGQVADASNNFDSGEAPNVFCQFTIERNPPLRRWVTPFGNVEVESKRAFHIIATVNTRQSDEAVE